ncbi:MULTISPECIES: SDR family NAD(P)-dependent oxidoreductase [Herbaspirillum]|jgi:NAD(P)-dependent dehydrogenase (short-subunit alcohol dehydrogenase family)|uniref:SDR family oxidoreductase n=2 Tax=Herbaspirillum rubrisubalbicans TaxID=80842 RepID=A0A6M3ZSJ9_9BURK|nr:MULTISPECIES: SDR family oxidoreductase [Herbaspirillum]MCP1572954.1 NAD(P)-dependent dehydrogenase (short-subunit alcohol dehydrogenase family) [Herbaspirillum rubrisubalbicans]QJQ01517.1 SDR family oxidoreductase [Herbaspirillum rubrisubalbicans Os34]
MMGILQGKVAIITGGGQGLGLGIAHALAAEGAQLVLTGRTTSTLDSAAAALARHGVEVVTASGDARLRADADAVVAQAIARLGRVDILVNNAQSSAPGVALEMIDDPTWEQTLESGLYGSFYFMQAVFPHMRRQGEGRIVNFGSLTGIEGTRGFGAYAAAKEGIRGLSRVAAREWGRYGINVNVICPAAMTEASAQYFAAYPAEKERYLSTIALGRMGEPEQDIGRAVVFLSGPDSRYMTGQTINVDGGQGML